jgi:glycosyltransferase involved in cell wall biosynthesis
MSKQIERSQPGASTVPQQSQPVVLVGIPAYNESGTIAGVVSDARTYADEVLVVDDGSDDATRHLARAAGATVITHETNRGYGATLSTIFRHGSEMGVDHLVILDGDGQHNVADVPSLVKTQQETGAELVSGSRFNGDSDSEIPRYRRFGLTVINLLTNLSLRIGYSYKPVSDSQCGFRVYNSDAVEMMANSQGIDTGMGASLDILFQTARHQYDIVEVPTKIDYDVDSANTRNPVLHGMSLLKSLFGSVLRDRPLRFGSAVTVLFMVPLAAAVALMRTGATAASMLVTMLVALLLVAGLTLLGTVSRRSGRTDQ